jgi:glycosyltransferase involved in cell wall biosynthesis
VSGILFLQFFRQQHNTLKEKFRYYRKYFTTKVFSKNKAIEHIYVLNDEKAVQYFNREFCTTIFRVLSDPIPELIPLENFDVYKEYGINKNRKIFLHAGVLGDRKGTLEILEAIPFFNSDEQRKICIFYAGESEDGFRELLREKIEYCRDNSEVKIVWLDEFISRRMLKTLFDQCYAVLLPYKMPEASSGIFGHAVAAGKIIIGSSTGLIGELIRNYETGITVDQVNGKAIAIAMRKASNLNQNIIINKHLSNTPSEFAKLLLS